MCLRLGLSLLLIAALASCSSAASQDFEIGYESKGCADGNRVLYSFTIHGDGRVEYFGKRGVKLLGHQEGRIDVSKAHELWLETEKMHLQDLKDRYWPTEWSDMAGFELSLRRGERRNSISFTCCEPDMKPSTPEEETCSRLSAFGQELEDAVHVTRWIGTIDEVFANHFWRERDQDAGR